MADDVDGDGRPEILCSAFVPDSIKIYAVESTGDNTYQQIWDMDLVHLNGQPVNGEVIVDGGDLDNDGRKEFLTGGLRTISQGGDPALAVFFLFEATSDNSFEVVATFTLPMTLAGLVSANVADVDGDGRREIILGAGTRVSVLQNTGDNAWAEIWSRTDPNYDVWTLGAGDHDRDGKEELLVQERGLGTTGVYEINPAYAADADDDGWVDAIDNCPSTGNPGQEDADADSVGNLCDNCVFGPNPTQGPAVFGESIWAVDARKFGWTVAAAIIYVRGDLALVDTYSVQVVQVLPLATSLTDAALPAVDQGFYYLVRPDCPVGSWQSTLGAEPARDEALP